MTDIDYPPTETATLEQALADVEGALVDVDDRLDRLADNEDATDQAIAEARAERSELTNQRDALQWAIGEFGADSQLTLEAFTTAKRSQTLDTANRQTMGQLGSSQLNDWLLAAAIADAPWLEGDEDLAERYHLLGALPPALTDWLQTRNSDLNDLTEGN